LGFVELVEWESGGFDVENEFGHCAGDSCRRGREG
jgi:hypothetical protein